MTKEECKTCGHEPIKFINEKEYETIEVHIAAWWWIYERIDEPMPARFIDDKGRQRIRIEALGKKYFLICCKKND